MNTLLFSLVEIRSTLSVALKGKLIAKPLKHIKM